MQELNPRDVQPAKLCDRKCDYFEMKNSRSLGGDDWSQSKAHTSWSSRD